MNDRVMVTCEVCGGDGHFDRVVGHDPSGPVWSDSFCSACQGAGEYAVKRESITCDDLDEIRGATAEPMRRSAELYGVEGLAAMQAVTRPPRDPS
jgi:hypothetical protein